MKLIVQNQAWGKYCSTILDMKMIDSDTIAVLLENHDICQDIKMPDPFERD